jgi:SAM-dependent methyltransferase
MQLPQRAHQPLIKRVKRTVLRTLHWNRFYQEKRPLGMEPRWAMIAAELSDEATLLDVGCNIGIYTRRAAEKGITALGVDLNPRYVERARSLHQDVPGLGFLFMNLGPREIARLPTFDATLCLSVHHQWARRFGLDESWEMVRILLGHTRRKLFFEPASIRSKYETQAPEIVDLDRESIIATNLAALRRVAPPDFSMRCLGESPCMGNEPFRLLFLAERA